MKKTSLWGPVARAVILTFSLVIPTWTALAEDTKSAKATVEAAAQDAVAETQAAAKTAVKAAIAAVAPEEARKLFDEGMALAKTEDYTNALDKLEAAVSSLPDDLRIGTEYRQVVIAAEEYDRCLAFFEQLVENHPESANVAMNYGFAHVDKIPAEGAITQVILANTALTQFTRSLELEESWLGYYTRGNSYLFWPAIFGRTPLGIADLEKAVEMSKKGEKQAYYGRAYASLGDGYWRLEDLAQANDIWRQGLELYPENQDLKDRVTRQGEDLDAFLNANFDTGRRVGTHLREIWGE